MMRELSNKDLDWQDSQICLNTHLHIDEGHVLENSLLG